MVAPLLLQLRARSSMHLRWKAKSPTGEHLVEQQDVGIEVGRHREGEAHVHAARIALDRRVDELGDLGELDDGVELALRSPRGVMPRIEP